MTTTTLTATELAEAIDAFLAPMRCTTPGGVGGSQPGMHCAECCMGTGWSGVTTTQELEASRALDQALDRLREAAIDRCPKCPPSGWCGHCGGDPPDDPMADWPAVELEPADIGALCRRWDDEANAL